jgi:hypothetical protein
MAVEADLGAAAAINLVALLAHNGTSAATWRIRAATSQANLTAAPGYDSGTVSMWPAAGKPAGYAATDRLHAIHYLATAQSFRWWRADLTDAANPDGYFEAGRLVIDAAWQPSRNFVVGWTLGVIDVSAPVRSARGHLWPGITDSAKARAIEFGLRALSEDEMRANAYELDRKRARSKDVLALRDPAANANLHLWTVYGLISELGPLRHITMSRYEKSYRVEEMTP